MMSRVYWHNIGKPYKQSWWDYLRNHGLITTGFGNKEGGAGEEILTGYRSSDYIIAYANGYGALAVGRPDPRSYRLVDEADVSNDFESDHRHWLSVDWLYGIESLENGVSFHEFQDRYGLYYPRKTSVIINDERAANRLIKHLQDIGDLSGSVALPEELDQPSRYSEGARKEITVNAYERNAKARQACIDHYGHQCIVCGFSFEEVYGKIGEGYIHVHHIRPLAEIGSEYEVDPIADLRPVCPNCHAMIHKRSVPFDTEEIIKLITRHRT